METMRSIRALRDMFASVTHITGRSLSLAVPAMSLSYFLGFSPIVDRVNLQRLHSTTGHTNPRDWVYADISSVGMRVWVHVAYHTMVCCPFASPTQPWRSMSSYKTYEIHLWSGPELFLAQLGHTVRDGRVVGGTYVYGCSSPLRK